MLLAKEMYNRIVTNFGSRTSQSQNRRSEIAMRKLRIAFSVFFLSLMMATCLEDGLGIPFSKASPEQEPMTQDERFEIVAQRLGYDLTGAAITPAQVGFDGQVERVYENIVLVLDESQPAGIGLRPLVILLAGAENKEQIEAQNENVGTPLDRELQDYIVQHGGNEVFGDLAKPAPAELSGDQQQCFSNLCLEYNRGADGSINLIEPVALGTAYLEQYPGRLIGHGWQIIAWKQSAIIGPSEQQRIYVLMLFDGTPVPGMMPRVSVYATQTPKNTLTWFMPLTGDDGVSGVEIAPLPSLLSGDLVAYQACVETYQEQRDICVEDSYLIWEEPPGE